MNQKDHWNFTLYEWTQPPFSWMMECIKEGDVVYDIGANVGAWSWLATDRGAKVTAFEPQKDNYAELIKNVECVAVNKGIYYGEKELIAHNTTDGNCGAYTVIPSKRTFQTEEVFELTTLEEYPLPKAVKLDVEGAEKNILKYSTLLKKVPVIILEWHYEDDAEEYVKKYLKHTVFSNIEGKMLQLVL